MTSRCLLTLVIMVCVPVVAPVVAQETIDMKPFQVQIEDAVIADLRDRLARTRWPDQIPDSGWERGPDVGYMRELCEYWRTGFDWPAQQSKINQWEVTSPRWNSQMSW